MMLINTSSMKIDESTLWIVQWFRGAISRRILLDRKRDDLVEIQPVWLFCIQGIFQVDVVALELVVNNNKSILYAKKASQSQGGVFGDVVVKAEAACSLFIYYPIAKIHG